MAGIDQDNFSNISWHSDQAGGSNTTMEAGHEDPGDRQGLGIDVDQLDAAGLGSEELVCTVSSPIKEGDGSKDAFVSYLITTRVRIKILS
jgi:sorting nexin-4